MLNPDTPKKENLLTKYPNTFLSGKQEKKSLSQKNYPELLNKVTL
jgi:hypothetical protein